MKSSLFSFSFCSIIVLFLVAGVASSDAQTFKIDGPKTYNFTASGGANVILNNRTAATQKIHVWLEGNTNNEISIHTNNLILHDTNISSGAEVVVTYTAHGPMTTNARLLFFDSVASRDTVYFNCQDILFHDVSHPYRIYSLDNKEIQGGTADPAHYIYFKHGNGGWELLMRVKNYRATPIAMTPSYIGSATGFSLVPNIFTLEAYPSNARSIDIKAVYQHTGNQYDTAMLVFKASDNSVPQDTLVFIGRDTTILTPTAMKGDTVDFGVTSVGGPVVYDIVIRNTTLSTVTLSDLVVGGNANKSFKSPFKSFTTLALAPGDSAVYVLEYNAPTKKQVYSDISFTFTTTNTKGVKGFLYYLFTAHTSICYPQKPSGSLVMEPSIPGGYTEASFKFQNNNSTTVMLKEITPSNGAAHPEYFTLVSPALPLWLMPYEVTELKFRFTPTDSVNGMAFAPLNFAFDINSLDLICTTMTYGLYCSTISTDDTSIIPLYPNQIASLPMASKQDTLTKRFRFQNNLNVPVTVASVNVSNTAHFRITSTNPAALPAIIQPNGEFTVDILFDAGANGYYTDSLVIVTDHSFMSQAFHLKALRTNGLPQSVEQSREVSPVLTITPNPAVNGVVTFNVSSGTKKIAIFDVLGNLISEKEHSTEWKWTAVNRDGQPLASGIYFVRVEGVSSTGRPFVISKKLVIER